LFRKLIVEVEEIERVKYVSAHLCLTESGAKTSEGAKDVVKAKFQISIMKKDGILQNTKRKWKKIVYLLREIFHTVHKAWLDCQLSAGN